MDDAPNSGMYVVVHKKQNQTQPFSSGMVLLETTDYRRLRYGEDGS